MTVDTKELRALAESVPPEPWTSDLLAMCDEVEGLRKDVEHLRGVEDAAMEAAFTLQGERDAALARAEKAEALVDARTRHRDRLRKQRDAAREQAEAWATDAERLNAALEDSEREHRAALLAIDLVCALLADTQAAAEARDARLRAEERERCAKAVCGYADSRCNSGRCPCHAVRALD